MKQAVMNVALNAPPERAEMVGEVGLRDFEGFYPLGFEMS